MTVPLLPRLLRPTLHCSVILVIATTGCGDPTDRVAGPPQVRSDLIVGGGITAPDAERAALGRLARFVAIAVNNPDGRKRLKRDLRAAPFKEHKLELAKYFRSADAEPLLDKMAASGGQSKSAILDAVNQLRSVELYMPVAKQRETWTGEGEILVAAQLVEHDPIMAFNGRGEAVPMDEATVPSQPILAIVGAETRFDRPMSPLTSRNINDRNGGAVGTLVPFSPPKPSMILLPGGGGGGGSPPPSVAPGLYLEFSRIVDVKEPWIRGEPEVEVHIHGLGEPGMVNDLSCSGDIVPDSRKYFDQNDGFWSGRVLLYSPEEVAANGYPDTPYHIIYWEDDNTPCLLKLDSPVLRNTILTTIRAVGSGGLVLIKGWAYWPAAAIAFVGAIYNQSGPWMLTNDDYIGDAVPSVPGRPNYFPDNTHIIMDGDFLNGRANIVWH